MRALDGLAGALLGRCGGATEPTAVDDLQIGIFQLADGFGIEGELLVLLVHMSLQTRESLRSRQLRAGNSCTEFLSQTSRPLITTLDRISANTQL